MNITLVLIYYLDFIYNILFVYLLLIMTYSPPDAQRGIEQSTLPDASSLAKQTSIPDFTTIICFILLCIYV